MRKPEDMTLSSRNDASVSRISLISGSGMWTPERGIWLKCSFVRPAEVKVCNK